MSGQIDRNAHLRISNQAPLLIDSTQYDVEPYTETAIVAPRDGYFSTPGMAYASE